MLPGRLAAAPSTPARPAASGAAGVPAFGPGPAATVLSPDSAAGPPANSTKFFGLRCTQSRECSFTKVKPWLGHALFKTNTRFNGACNLPGFRTAVAAEVVTTLGTLAWHYTTRAAWMWHGHRCQQLSLAMPKLASSLGLLQHVGKVSHPSSPGKSQAQNTNAGC